MKKLNKSRRSWMNLLCIFSSINLPTLPIICTQCVLSKESSLPTISTMKTGQHFMFQHKFPFRQLLSMIIKIIDSIGLEELNKQTVRIKNGDKEIMQRIVLVLEVVIDLKSLLKEEAGDLIEYWSMNLITESVHGDIWTVAWEQAEALVRQFWLKTKMILATKVLSSREGSGRTVKS